MDDRRDRPSRGRSNNGGGFGGRNSGGGQRRSGGGSFGGGRSFGGGQRRFNNGPREMHNATCAECGNECQVPFKPSGDKPVYCRDCFQKHRPQRF